MAVKSKTALGTDIDTKLASASNITATEHRSLEHDIVDSYEDFIASYTTAQIAALGSMTTRQIVYDTDIKAYYYYDGTAWQPFTGRAYKVYKAYLTQSGTSAPSATVLENTLGGTVVWTRDDVGIYKGTLAGAFTSSSTICLNQSIVQSSPMKFMQVYVTGADEINVLTFDASFADADDCLNAGAHIEIQVYP